MSNVLSVQRRRKRIIGFSLDNNFDAYVPENLPDTAEIAVTSELAAFFKTGLAALEAIRPSFVKHGTRAYEVVVESPFEVDLFCEGENVSLNDVNLELNDEVFNFNHNGGVALVLRCNDYDNEIFHWFTDEELDTILKGGF